MFQLPEPPAGTKYVELFPGKVEEIFSIMSGIKWIFDDYSRGNLELFKRFMQRQDSLWLERTDGNGLVYATNIVPRLRCQGHIVYWDKKLRGREEFTKDCMKWFFDHLGLIKIDVLMPTPLKVSIAFAKRIGFRSEGVVRDWSTLNSKPFDMMLLGITREEAFNGVAKEISNGDAEGSVQPAGDGLPGDSADDQ